MKRFALLSFGILVSAADGATAAAAEASRDQLGPKEAEIDDALCSDNARAGPWNAAWTVTFSVAAVTTASLATFAPHDWFSSNTRAGLYVTAAKATVGAVAKLVLPLELHVGRLCDEGHATGVGVRRALLSEAAAEERSTLMTNIVGGVLLNSAGLLYLGFGRGSWESGWISFGVGSAVSVLTTLTAPTHAWLLNRRLEEARHVAAVPMLGRGSAGVALVATW